MNVIKRLTQPFPIHYNRFQQARFKYNTVNFFQRRTGEVLWKTVTSVTPAGRKRGRSKTRQPIRPLRALYRIGSSPMKVLFPGLNAPLDYNNLAEPIHVAEQTDEERQASLGEFRTRVEKMGKRKKHLNKEKLYPLERGFSGIKVVGQKLGPPVPYCGINLDDFETICLHLRRTCAMGPIGRMFSSEALVFIGNGKGMGGYGVGISKDFDTKVAILRGQKNASKHIFTVELLENRTIYQDFFGESHCTRVYAFRTPQGSGLCCHPRLFKICQLLGIKDIYVKTEGSTNNYFALTNAFITGLLNQETHQQLAEKTRLHVVELKKTCQYFPKVVASPLTVPVKTEAEMTDMERMRLDDYYGEGRLPQKKRAPWPIWINSKGNIHAVWSKQPYRNMEKCMVRLLADGVVERWTRKNRKEHGQKLHKLAESNVISIPEGIGLGNRKLLPACE